MQRFFLSPSCFSEQGVRIDSPEVLHQMQKVLRFRAGDQFIALDGEGHEYLCTLVELSGKSAIGSIQKKYQNQAEPTCSIRLYQALPKKMALFEWVLEKGTEIGVSEFVPLITARTERQVLPKLERLEKILQESAEQSERGKIPKLLPPQSLGDGLKDAQGLRLLLHSRETPEARPLRTNGSHESAYSLFIGPEGGFSEEEVAMAKEAGAQIVHLGPRILRTETAGIVAAALLLLE